MSRKRHLKKQQKRREDARARLAGLVARGAVDDALALAAREWKDPGASAASELWAETADRALGEALAAADAPRLRRLLPRVQSAAAPRPLAAVAAAVLDLHEGRLEPARSRLDELAAGTAAGDLPPELVAGLRALARGPALPAAEDATPSPAAELWDALRALEAAGHEAGAAELEALGERIAAARSGAAGDARAVSLLDLCRRHLEVASDLASLLEELAGTETGPDALPPSGRVRAWLGESGERGTRLAATLVETGPPLAEPLRHFAYRRWRAVLERVAAAEGAAGVAAVAARDPRLAAGELRRPDGAPADPGVLAEGSRAQALLEEERFDELRRLLRKRSRAERDPGELAALWGLELRVFNLEEAEEDEDYFDGPSPLPHDALVRLGEMAAEIGRRFAPEERKEVARALREELLRLCESVPFCDHFGAAARSLLAHAEGDPGLLLVAATGAVVGHDRAARKAVEERLARQRPMRAPERDLAVRIMGQVAFEDPRDVAEVLRLVRPLFGEEVWPAVRDRMARELVGLAAGGLERAADIAEFSEEDADEVLQRLREDLEGLRPDLGAAPGFAAAELALRCRTGTPRAAEKETDAYLAAHPGWEAALLPAKALAGAVSPLERRTGAAAAMTRLGNAAVERLDDRWQLWLPDLPTLALACDAGHQRRLLAKLRRLRRAPGLTRDDREVLGGAVKVLEDARNLLKALEGTRRLASVGRSRGPSGGSGGAAGPPAGRRKRKPRGGGDEEQQLDLGFLD